MNVQILHLWLHFLQIIFVIFQNLRWSITRARIRPTSLFQAILFSSFWSAWISILMKASTKFHFLPLLPDPFCLRPRFFGFAGNAVFVPLSEDKYPDCRGIILTDGIVVGFCIDCINALNNVLQRFACAWKMKKCTREKSSSIEGGEKIVILILTNHYFLYHYLHWTLL